jgi:hypothetical protein
MVTIADVTAAPVESATEPTTVPLVKVWANRITLLKTNKRAKR